MRKRISRRVRYLIILLVVFTVSGETIYSIIKNEINLYRLKKQKSKLMEENRKLSEMISYAHTKEFVEYNARIMLGLKKDDEIEYRFDPPQEDDE